MLACVLCHLSQEWISLERPKGAPWPVRRDSHAACCLNYGEDDPQLLVTGGVDNNGNSLQDAWVLDVKSGRWREVRIYQWFNCLSLQYADHFSSDSFRLLFVLATYVDSYNCPNSITITKPDVHYFQSLSSLSPAYHSWRCTTPSKAHCYSLKFGTRVDRSHHVWGMPKVEVGKVK